MLAEALAVGLGKAALCFETRTRLRINEGHRRARYGSEPSGSIGFRFGVRDFCMNLNSLGPGMIVRHEQIDGPTRGGPLAGLRARFDDFFRSVRRAEGRHSHSQATLARAVRLGLVMRYLAAAITLAHAARSASQFDQVAAVT